MAESKADSKGKVIQLFERAESAGRAAAEAAMSEEEADRIVGNLVRSILKFMIISDPELRELIPK